MKCISCGDEFIESRRIQINSIKDNKVKIPISFCKCGLGKTIYDYNSESLLNFNLNIYNNLDDRIKIYYSKLIYHITVRYNESLRKIKEFKTQGSFLELGSNIGFTANIAHQNGFDVIACEINDNCRALSLLINSEIKHVKDYFALSENFNIITMLDVLEHFPNPEKALLKAKELLNPGGIIYIQLPNVRSNAARFFGDEWSFYAPPDHSFHFTPDTLISFLRRNGYGVKWIRTCDVIEDLKLIRILPKKFKKNLIELIYRNPFYHPGFYLNTKNKGSIIQCIASAKSISSR